jgi:mRNA-degrading endonuclease YafQ of YafQ-DinJ toxin-antitoxin module
MRKIVFSPKFGRALRRYVKRNPELRSRIENVIQQMELDVFSPSLGTHLSTPHQNFDLQMLNPLGSYFF